LFAMNPSSQFTRIREPVGVQMQTVDEQILAPTVWDHVSFSPRNYGYSDAEVAKMVSETLERVGIEHLRDKVCHHLSGGEKRKVALAGALVLNPELLVLDEPFEGLDPASRSDLVSLLNHLHAERGVTLVIATHDVNVVPAMADRVYVLVRGGEIVAQGPPRDVFADPALLRRSNIEPPVLAELFERLDALGMRLGRPITVEEAAQALAAWSARAAGGRVAEVAAPASDAVSGGLPADARPAPTEPGLAAPALDPVGGERRPERS